MKKLQFLILVLLASVIVCQAQITNLGWFRANPQDRPSLLMPSLSAKPLHFRANATMLFSQTGVPTTPIAETVTPQIQDLADGLQDNPTNIFNYVHDHIKFVLYFGSKKGAELTLLEKSGNDFDQSALLMALLRAAGYSNAVYQFGWMYLPYDDSSGNDYDLHHWWQLTLNNTNWTTTTNYLQNLASERDYPTCLPLNDGNSFLLQRTWVALTIGSTTYQLDPAFKVSEPISTVSLTNAMGSGSISNDLITAAAGTNTGNYAQKLNEASIRSKLTSYTTNLLNFIQTNSPNADVKTFLGGWQIVPAQFYDFSTSTTFATEDFSGTLPILTWANEPTNIMSTLQIFFAGTSYKWFMPQLQGQRLSLTFDGSGTAQLWQDDVLLTQNATGNTSGSSDVTLFVHHPAGTWDFVNNNYVDGTYSDQIATDTYQSSNSIYALIYAFEPDWGWLQQRQNRLDTYLQQGLDGGSRQVTSETLNIMGLNWMLQTANAEQMLASQLGILPQYYHRLGRMAQETGRGYYVDVYMQLTGQFPSGGYDAAHIEKANDNFNLSSVFSSALEHGIIEQLQNSNQVAASTVKMLQIANTNNQFIYLASSTNWTTGYNVKTHLTNYDATTLSTIGTLIAANYYILLPQNASNRVSTTGTWAGYGYEAQQSSNNVAANSQMVIAGGYYGGYPGDSTIPIDTPYIQQSGQDQSSYYTQTPVATTSTTSGDPVDTANDTFQVEHDDLSFGQAAPQGISISRFYNGTRRFSNSAGMSGGWLHNYCITANRVAAPQACLGGTTPAQAASMLAAITAAVVTYDSSQPNARNWLTTALIAKWGIDQLTKSGAAINLGKDTLQFVQQPNGIFTPPANSTATLTRTNSAYILQMRHGNKFQFNSKGFLTNIVDQYNQNLSITYNSSNYVSTISDWQARPLTFTYSGTPKQLTMISNSTYKVSYAYSTAYNPQGDLTSFTDPEGKTTSYVYDTNHQIIATIDALSRLVVSNVYNSQGHVTTQYTQGDANKIWRMYWSGWQTTVFDPANGRTDNYYDDEGRLTAVVDPLGNEANSIYDGQNHVVCTISPLFETNKLVYDGNNNLIQTIDPLGFTNQFIYDNQNNLIHTIDSLGNTNSLGYNARFSLTGSTNGAGDFISYAYNTDGTLLTRTDAGGTTTNAYDTYGQLSKITYPGGLGSENLAFDRFGNLTNHTDARGFITQFQYNKRCELTNSIAPSNVVVRVIYDPVGNVSSTMDALGNVVSNTWSVTRQLLATTLPATAQGTPVVAKIYDNRDWLQQSIDPLQNSTFYSNDVSGRLASQTDSLSRISIFKYDADGHRVATINAASETNSQTLDARGSSIKLTDGAGHFSTRAYDAVGNQVYLTNRNGKKWQFQFDAANRLTNTITPLGRSTAVTFNHQGRPAGIKDPSTHTTSFYYDARGRLTNRADTVATTLYRYDANNNLTNVAEGGLTNVWTYDAYGRISSYKDVYGNLIQYRYDANGNLTNLIYPGNRNVYYAYDNLNRMTNVTDWSNRKTSIIYDLNAHVTSITHPNGTYRTIGYDATGQATNIQERTALGAPIAIFRHNWNANATMQWEFAAPLPHTNAPPPRTMAYDDDNELASVDGTNTINDLNGNLTSGPLTNDVFANYAYDSRNRLQNVGGVTNIYDAQNNRISQFYGTNVINYVINPNTKLTQVLMRIKNGVTNYYVYGFGLLYQINETAATTNTLTYHCDYRGSTVALTDDGGNVTDRIEYSTYGSLTYRVGNSDTPFLFNGRYGVQTDANGLLYMRSRYYNPFLCRFINPDPSGFKGGLNFFAYANDNPVSLTDPFGLSSTATGDMVDNTSWTQSIISQGDIDAANQHEARMQAVYASLNNQTPIQQAFGNALNSAFIGVTFAGGELFDGFGAMVYAGDAAEDATMFSSQLGSTGPRATTELLDAMQAHGRTITTATEGSEALRFLDTMGAEASAGGEGHLSIILRKNPSQSAAMEEFLHGTQDRLGIIDRLGVQGAENHVTDFMTRHSRLLGLEP